MEKLAKESENLLSAEMKETIDTYFLTCMESIRALLAGKGPLTAQKLYHQSFKRNDTELIGLMQYLLGMMEEG